MARLTICTFAAALLFATQVSAQAGKADKADKVVKITATATKIDAEGKQRVTITITMEPNWHIYANPVQNDELKDAATLVKIDAKAEPVSVKVNYPTGSRHEDKDIGVYFVYEKVVDIEAFVERAASDTSPLQVTVRFNACDLVVTKECLLTKTRTITIP